MTKHVVGLNYCSSLWYSSHGTVLDHVNPLEYSVGVLLSHQAAQDRSIFDNRYFIEAFHDAAWQTQ